jgi:hypothetical protein
MASAGTIAGISVVWALLLATYVLAYNKTLGCTSIFTNTTVFWITFLLWGTFLNFAGNAVIQISSCDKVNYEHILKNSGWIPGLMLFFLGVSYMPFFSTAVGKALPESVHRIGEREVISYTNAYYMFWAGLFGQMLSGGFSSMCPA